MKAMDVGQRPGSEIQQKNHVERAIIMAAGTGTRMRPVTLTTPKPLIRVKGVRMIDTVIQALHENGIYEIYVVVGYRKEQFACLTAEYKGVTLIENPYWDSCSATLDSTQKNCCRYSTDGEELKNSQHPRLEVFE